MSGKEERIRVLLAKNPCKGCKVKKCTRKCMFGLLFEKEPGITRQEAIEVMAKRLIFEGVNKFECHTIAKWCLDELLKGVKNETH